MSNTAIEIARRVSALLARSDELAELASDVFDGHSGYRMIRGAMLGVQRIRLSTFLAALETGESELGETEKQRFRGYVGSELAQELLLDYSQTVIRTSSRVAIAALGLLFPDQIDERYPPRFRRLACEVLEGISDDDVDAFLALADLADAFILEVRRQAPGVELPKFTPVVGGMVRGRGDGKGPYVVIGAEGEKAADRLGLTPAQAYAACERLQTRSLLLRDFVDGGWGSSSYLTFGLADDHERFRGLLGRARDLVAGNPV